MQVKIKNVKNKYLLSKNFSLEEITNKCQELMDSYPLTKDDERYEQSQEFYKKYHFYYEECWNLDSTMATFILPRLIHFRDVYSGTPGTFFKYDKKFNIVNEKQGNKKWNKTIDLMIEAFYRIIFIDDLSLNEEDRKINSQYINLGLKLFAKYFQALWD